MSEEATALDASKPGFLLTLLHILVVAAIGNLIFAGGALLMGIDSRLACLGGLVIVLIAPLIVFLLVSWQTSSKSAVRPALLSCWLILMLVQPISSWLCEWLYWHWGNTGTVIAFAAAVPIVSIVALWWCVGSLREHGLWEACSKPGVLLAIGFIALWVVTAWQLLCISLAWPAIVLPAVKDESLPAAISRDLTAFLPMTVLLVLFARFVAGLGRRTEAKAA